MIRRKLAIPALIAVLSLALEACASTTAQSAVQSVQSVQSKQIADIVRTTMEQQHLRAVIVEITENGKVIAKRAFGPSLAGEPATPNMYFRNGAVAFEYLTTLLMEFVDEHKVTLDDTIQKWEPSLPEADKVTLKMLANQTTGYPDFETDNAWTAAFYADPDQSQSFQTRLGYAFGRPMQFAPGTNWSYAHTNFMILGDILAKIGKKPLDVLLRDKVIKPMGLDIHRLLRDRLGSEPGAALVQLGTARRPRHPVWRTLLRGGDLLERRLGRPCRRQRDDDDRRHDPNRGRRWHRQARVEVELHRDDRAIPARLRHEGACLRTLVLHADPCVQLRPRYRAPGFVADTGPAGWRLQRN